MIIINVNTGLMIDGTYKISGFINLNVAEMLSDLFKGMGQESRKEMG